MRCVIFGSACAQDWLLTVEDAGEEWSAAVAADYSAAEALLRAGQTDVLILGTSPDARWLCRELVGHPCIPPPYLVAEEAMPTQCDIICPAQAMQRLTTGLTELQEACRLPVMCLASLEHITCLARALLHALGVRPGLRAMRFLPDMLALGMLHPALFEDLSARLYPLVARRHGITPSAVERSLRLLIESTWSRVPPGVLERFFGHSVDPERGKPTNREFLAQLQQRLLLASRRWEK